MRYFLGFDLSAQDKLAIDAWRSKFLPAFDTSVPVQNFHITAVFLGQMKSNQLDRLTQELDVLKHTTFSFHLNQMGYWSKPKVLWLGCTNVPKQAISLYETLFELAKQSGLSIPTRDYNPHVTLVRKVAHNPPSALIDPDFEVQVQQLHLFESVSGNRGVRYPIRQSWELQKAINPKWL